MKLTFLIAMGFLALGVTACGERERDVDTAAAEGILLMGNGGEPRSLDPHLVTGVPENRIIQALIEGLIAYHPDDDTLPEPGIAESWEHNEDYTVWTFNLREDAQWTNGDPVVAGDFVYSWERILSPALGAEYAEMLYVINNAEAFHQGEIDDFSQVGVRAIDDRTLEVQLKGPTPHFLLMLKHYSFYPVNPRVVEEHGGMTDRQSGWSTVENYVGNGPFRLTHWSTNEVLEVEKNPDYWDADTVQLNGIRFFPIENVNTEFTAFQGGRLHVTNVVPADRIPSLREQMPDQLIIEPYLGSYFYRLNVTREPFDDPRVREALALAIDRSLIVERVTQGGQAVATGFVPEGITGYQPTDAVGHDPERAQALLAQAGYPGGQGFPETEILINTSENHRKVAEAIQAMWRETLGIEVGIYNQEWKVYLDSQSSLDYDISRSGWIADYVHPMTFLELFTTGNGNNDTGWSNTQYDRLIRQAQAATTEDQRIDLLTQAEGILMEDLPVVPIYWYTRVYMRDPRVQGWNAKILDYRPYKYVSLSTS
ncbi:ABC transporter substrate-binding protein [Parasphingopyxis sp.]|uniref:peptide ABC transporter substrate-binding protein n=1 Tax=Parasphingopyxis sp. TaxID=1920299 RepID=UPI002630E52F|nr:peptide ABC transporter substrate-binding protein [Parasphingopyxis sp.]